VLQAALAEAVEDTFNSITVDGDMSTNDEVIALANGRAGAPAMPVAPPPFQSGHSSSGFIRGTPVNGPGLNQLSRPSA